MKGVFAPSPRTTWKTMALAMSAAQPSAASAATRGLMWVNVGSRIPRPPSKSNRAVVCKNVGETSPAHGIAWASSGMGVRNPGYEEDCSPVRELLTRFGDKWSVLVIAILGERTRRFSELKRAVGGISQRMLTHTLRSLERDGLVARSVVDAVPPRVSYRLTPLGESLFEPLRSLVDWAQTHRADVQQAREVFLGKVRDSSRS